MPRLRDAAVRLPESEKLTLNLGYVDLGRVDLLVADGFYANRSDFIRTAIRDALRRHEEAVAASSRRRKLELGLVRLDRADLEAALAAGETLDLAVLGLAVIADDVSPELARQAIASIQVLGAFQAPPAVKAALADRTV